MDAPSNRPPLSESELQVIKSRMRPGDVPAGSLEVVFNERLETAAALPTQSGHRIEVNPAFWASLSRSEQDEFIGRELARLRYGFSAIEQMSPTSARVLSQAEVVAANPTPVEWPVLEERPVNARAEERGRSR